MFKIVFCFFNCFFPTLLVTMNIIRAMLFSMYNLYYTYCMYTNGKFKANKLLSCSNSSVAQTPQLLKITPINIAHPPDPARMLLGLLKCT